MKRDPNIVKNDVGMIGLFLSSESLLPTHCGYSATDAKRPNPDGQNFIKVESIGLTQSISS